MCFMDFLVVVLSNKTAYAYVFLSNSIYKAFTFYIDIDVDEEIDNLSRGIGFPTVWYVRPAKSQISLHIRAV